MKAEILESIDFNEYENCLSSDVNDTFFHSLNHLQYLSGILNNKPKFVVVNDGEKILGCLPFFSKKEKAGEIINSLPFFGSYGGALAPTIEVKKTLLEELNQYNKYNEVLSCTIITNPFEKNYSAYEENFEFHTREERMIQCTDLTSKTEEQMFTSLEKRTRWSIRKAEKNNINVISVNSNQDYLNEFYKMHEDSMKIKGGRPKPKSIFENVLKNFIPEKDYEILAATKDGKSLAFVLVFYYKQYAEYYMPAYNAEFLNLQSPSLLIWTTIKNAIKRNMKFYNFGGTWKNQESLYLFKRSWGAIDLNYNYYIFRDIDRIREYGIDQLMKDYEFYYICPYDDVKTSERT